MIALHATYNLSTFYAILKYNEKFIVERGVSRPINWTPHLLESVGSKKIMLIVYEDLAKDGWISKIEDLNDSEIDELRKECDDCGAVFSKNAARILYTIHFLNDTINANT